MKTFIVEEPDVFNSTWLNIIVKEPPCPITQEMINEATVDLEKELFLSTSFVKSESLSLSDYIERFTQL